MTPLVACRVDTMCARSTSASVRGRLAAAAARGGGGGSSNVSPRVDTTARFDANNDQVNALFGSYTTAANARRIVMGLKLNF